MPLPPVPNRCWTEAASSDPTLGKVHCSTYTHQKSHSSLLLKGEESGRATGEGRVKKRLWYRLGTRRRHVPETFAEKSARPVHATASANEKGQRQAKHDFPRASLCGGVFPPCALREGTIAQCMRRSRSKTGSLSLFFLKKPTFLDSIQALC